ncbi:hypothetical protein [Couchioplanes azureus]|nr:hypothetical protein [Couchioplanes caeruleus]
MTEVAGTAADRNGVAKVQKFTVQLRAYDSAGDTRTSAARTYRR